MLPWCCPVRYSVSFGVHLLNIMAVSRKFRDRIVTSPATSLRWTWIHSEWFAYPWYVCLLYCSFLRKVSLGTSLPYSFLLQTKLAIHIVASAATNWVVPASALNGVMCLCSFKKVSDPCCRFHGNSIEFLLFLLWIVRSSTFHFVFLRVWSCVLRELYVPRTV